jgi:hypothetical protein
MERLYIIFWRCLLNLYRLFEVSLKKKGIHSQAGYGFYVKLTPMITAKPLG